MSSPTPVDTTAMATRVIYELLGRRWVWPEVTTTEHHQPYPGQRKIVLQGRPVTEVIEIFHGDKLLDGYTVESGRTIRLAAPVYRAGCGSDARLSVRYSYGSPPPEGVAEAIRVLADELQLGIDGSNDCRLPQRVTSITRQGVTMTMLDSQEFLDEGKTGIAEIDAVLRQFNPGQAKRPARVFGRMTPPPSRTNTVQAPTP